MLSHAEIMNRREIYIWYVSEGMNNGLSSREDLTLVAGDVLVSPRSAFPIPPRHRKPHLSPGILYLKLPIFFHKLVDQPKCIIGFFSTIRQIMNEYKDLQHVRLFLSGRYNYLFRLISTASVINSTARSIF